jgi:hypothetical protein
VSRSTITRAVGEVRPLTAERGCTVEDGIRLRTLADVVAHLGASGRVGLLSATEVRVRRPAAGRAGRQRFVSGQGARQHRQGPGHQRCRGAAAVCGQTRSGAIHDLTQVRQPGLVELLVLVPGVTLLADAGYQGLGAQTAGAVVTPRRARRKNQRPVPPLSPRRTGANVGLTRLSGSASSTASATWRTGGPCLGTSAAGSTSTRCCVRSPDCSPARSEPSDLASLTASR